MVAGTWYPVQPCNEAARFQAVGIERAHDRAAHRLVQIAGAARFDQIARNELDGGRRFVQGQVQPAAQGGAFGTRGARVVALEKPSEQERGQWYFQRYIEHLPTYGEMVFFDRSWYNRAGVERVMGFCTDDQYEEFFRSAPEFERMLARSGIQLIKYWFSISDEEQELRFLGRIHDPLKQWKLSPMDLRSRDKWVEYSQAKDRMFDFTDTKQSPWYVVNADDKKRARLNCISHLLAQFDYEDVAPDARRLTGLEAQDVAWALPHSTDNSLYHKNPLDLDPERIQIRRVLDVNDRFLRSITIGQGGPAHGAADWRARAAIASSR